MRSITHTFTAFVRASDAMIAPIIAMVLTTIMAVMVLALDVRAAIDTKHRLQQASDHAALHTARLLYDRFVAETVDEVTDTELTDQARLIFQEQAHGLVDDLTKLSVTHALDDGVYSVTVNYSAQVSKILDDYNYTVSDQSTAIVDLKTYTFLNLHILVDQSASMAMGASEADQIDLWRTRDCAFACHESDVDYARRNEITLRQDQAIAAVNTIVDRVEEIVEVQDFIRETINISLWHFSASHEYTFVGESDDPSRLRPHITALADTAPEGDTNVAGAFGSYSLERAVEYRGTGWLFFRGQSHEEPNHLVIFVTDGISNHGERAHIGNEDSGAPHYNNYCSGLKDKGLGIGMIYVPHQNYADTMRAVYGDVAKHGGAGTYHYPNMAYADWADHYNRHLAVPLEHVEETLQDCASPNLYYRATDLTDFKTHLESYLAQLDRVTMPNPYLVN